MSIFARLIEIAAAASRKRGDRVTVRWHDGHDYPATVKKVTRTHTHVEWDDDSPDEAMPHGAIKGAAKKIPFAHFVKKMQGKQHAYIDDEEKRYTKLEGLRRKHNPDDKPFHEAPIAYKRAANALGLHPQTKDEIAARHKQLKGMRKELPKKYGASNPGMRAQYELHTGG